MLTLLVTAAALLLSSLLPCYFVLLRAVRRQSAERKEKILKQALPGKSGGVLVGFFHPYW